MFSGSRWSDRARNTDLYVNLTATDTDLVEVCNQYPCQKVKFQKSTKSTILNSEFDFGMLSIDSNFRVERWWSSWIAVATVLTFTSVATVKVPLPPSYDPWNSLCHLFIAGLDKNCAPYACCNNAYVSAGCFFNCTQNEIAACCSFFTYMFSVHNSISEHSRYTSVR